MKSWHPHGLYIDATDGLITWFGQRHHLPVHYAFPSLVQHVGRRSSGLAGGWHESACFVQEVGNP